VNARKARAGGVASRTAKPESSASIPSVAAKKLWKAACAARRQSYSPYSKFAVGAAGLFKGGRVFAGANVENASYGGTVCAERIACFKAVTEGARELRCLVVVAEGPRPVAPCGFCLQVLSEFAKPETEIWLANSRRLLRRFTLAELLPQSFGADDLLFVRE
jgi:homotetrameric cytidine deaminase